MTLARKWFSSFKKQDTGVYVQVSGYDRYRIGGFCIIPFHIESSNSLYFDNVSFVQNMRDNFLSTFIMEDKGFTMEYKN